MAVVGTHAATLQVSLIKYPSATPANVPIQLIILHPCNGTTFIQTKLKPMTYEIGKNAVIQEFSQVLDSIAEMLKDSKLCKERVYTLVEGGDVIQFSSPNDPWTS